jgi:hypothetical protein
MAVASEPLQRALLLTLETGQRQGDLLALPWSAYCVGGDRTPCLIPVTRGRRAVLGNTKRTASEILG